MANAADAGVAKVRELTSLCDWCGSECSGQVEVSSEHVRGDALKSLCLRGWLVAACLCSPLHVA
jgi:hypothetical protein